VSREAYASIREKGAECALAHPAARLAGPSVMMTRSTRYEVVTESPKGSLHRSLTVGPGYD
jgi:hypothetical protein